MSGTVVYFPFNKKRIAKEKKKKTVSLNIAFQPGKSDDYGHMD